jgi:putative NADH-flavin reductase
MRLTVFGATGRAGGAIVRQARATGHEVHALVRTPGGLDSADVDSVDVVVGDVRDQAAVERVVKDADAVVSAIGGTGRDNPCLLFDGTANVLAAAKRHGVSRLIVIQGFHLPFPGDPRGVGRPLMAAMLRLWNRHLSADTYRMANLLRAADLDWTLIRMPRLVVSPCGGGPSGGGPSGVSPSGVSPSGCCPSDGPSGGRSDGGGYRTGRLALGPWSTVTTGQVAHFTMACLEQGGFPRDAPMICSTKKRPSVSIKE